MAAAGGAGVQRSRATPRVLSIAGTDPTGGAGVQADLKSIAAHGGYGMAVATALVAQNTQGVGDIHVPPAEFLAAQLTAVSDDVDIDAVKIGMLFDADLIRVVGSWLDAVGPPLVVLDPVMVATSGDRLLTPNAEAALLQLISRADLVTPNLQELAALLGQDPATIWPQALQQGRELGIATGVHVLLKGGHLDGDRARDALIDPTGTVVAEYDAPRVDTPHTHGTGCSLSSAVATRRARGESWQQAIGEAKSWLTESIAAGADLAVGRGRGPISHFAGLWRRAGTTTPAADTIRDQWWSGIAGMRDRIAHLPFVRGLADGSLAEEDFGWYLAQDALYLRDYARALAEASRLAPTPDQQAFWAAAARDALVAELDLHRQWLSGQDVFDAVASRETTAYTNHLLASSARGGYRELIAALLPCFWIYAEVGSALVGHAREGHRYARWLQTYSDPEFAAQTRRAIEIVCRHAAAADPAERDRMWSAFEASSRHEWAFFAAPTDRHLPPRRDGSSWPG